MQTLVNKTARELARDYYNGVLSFEDYRTRRRRLVDQVTGVAAEAEPEADAADPEQEPASSPTVPIRMAGAKPTGAPAVETPEPRGIRPPIIAVLGIAVAGILGWLMLSGEDDADSTPVAERELTAPEAPAQRVPETDSVRQLVTSFVQADDWSTGALGDFVLAWGALSEADQQRARQASWFLPLAEQLREQILEQRALGDIDSNGWEPGREEVLVSFAEHVGLSQLLADLGQTVIATVDSGEHGSAGQGATAVSEAPAVQEPATDSEPEAARQDAAVQGVEETTEPVAPPPRDTEAPEPAVGAEPGLAEQAAAPDVEPQPETKPQTEAARETVPEPETAEVPETQVARDPQAEAPQPATEQPVVPEPAAPVPSEPVVKPTSPLQSAAPAPVRKSSAAAQTASPEKPAAAPREQSTAKPDDPCPASRARTRRPLCRDSLPDGKPGPTMVVLPAGSFNMGSTRAANEQPVHPVQIGKAFAISAYEISVGEYQRFCQASGRSCPPGRWTDPLHPRVNVSWDDARAYTQWLSAASGAVYRLPTEAEWEYAARGGKGTDYPFSAGDKVLPSDARFNASRPLPVNDRSVNLNGFKLRHIVGNAREWVADAWFEDYRGAPGDGSARLQQGAAERVVRGGSYADSAERLRSAARQGLPATQRDTVTGFRIVREVHN